MSESAPQPDPPPPLPALPRGFEPVPQQTGREQPQTARLTVVAAAYHYPAGSSPSETPLRWSEQLVTDEQPWKRWFTVEERWQSIEVGWIETASLLVLTNCELAGRSDAIVELGLDTAAPQQEGRAEVAVTAEQVRVFAELPPGRGCLLRPVTGLHLADYVVRCRNGKARCCLVLLPN